MCMVCSENDMGESIFKMNNTSHNFSYKVPTLRTEASKRGVGWGLGWPVPMRKLLVKFRPQLGLYHDCAFMLI